VREACADKTATKLEFFDGAFAVTCTDDSLFYVSLGGAVVTDREGVARTAPGAFGS
jgi:hypothetical protein